MELHKVLKEIIESHGVGIIHDNRFLNILSDYKAFEGVPASKYDVLMQQFCKRV